MNINTKAAPAVQPEHSFLCGDAANRVLVRRVNEFPGGATHFVTRAADGAPLGHITERKDLPRPGRISGSWFVPLRLDSLVTGKAERSIIEAATSFAAVPQ